MPSTDTSSRSPATPNKAKGRGCTRNGIYLLDAAGSLTQHAWGQVRVYTRHPVTGEITKISHWRDVSKLEHGGDVSWDGRIICVNGNNTDAKERAQAILNGADAGSGIWETYTNSNMSRGRRVPERLANLRMLATVDAELAASTNTARTVSPAYAATVAWLRQASVLAPVSDAALVEHLAFETKVSSVHDVSVRHELVVSSSKSKSTPRQQALRARTLITKLVEAGYDEATILELSQLGGSAWGSDAYCQQVSKLAALVREGAVSGKFNSELVRVAQQFSQKGLLHQVDRQIEFVAGLLNATRDNDILNQLDVLDACVLYAEDIVVDDSLSVENWGQVAYAYSAHNRPVSLSAKLGRQLDDDPVKLHLVLGSDKPLSELEALADEIAGLKRFEALMAHGTITDVAWAHARAAKLSPDEASALARTFCDAPHNLKARDHEDDVTRVRSLSVPAFQAALAQAQTEHDAVHAGYDVEAQYASAVDVVDEFGFTHVAAKQAVLRGGRPAREWHPSAIDSAVRLSVCFGKEWPQWLKAGRAASKTSQNRQASIHDLSYWLPMENHAKEFGTWVRQKNRVQSLFVGRRGEVTLRRIGEDFSVLSDAERKLSVTDVVAVLRAKGYGNLGLTDLGQLGGELDIPPSTLTRVAPRWAKSFETPSPFPLTELYHDEASGLRGYFLARHDPRGLFLGQLTDCCQYPGSAGESCAWAGTELPLHGFFVVEDRSGTVVAQSWVWADGKGGMCFDNIERKTSTADGWNANWDGGAVDAADAMAGPGVEGEAADEDDVAASAVPSDSIKMTPSQKRTWAIRRVYHDASRNVLDRFEYVTVGTAMTKIPLDGYKRAKGDRIVDCKSSGYNGYRDSHTQAIMAQRRRNDGRILVAGCDGGFAFEKREEQDDDSIVVTRVEVVGDKVTLIGEGAADIAIERLAMMGPRQWTVVDTDGNEITDPRGEDWKFGGDTDLAIPDASEYLSQDADGVYSGAANHHAVFTNFDIQNLASYGLTPEDDDVQFLVATGCDIRVIVNSIRSVRVADGDEFTDAVHKYVETVAAYPHACRANYISGSGRNVDAETATTWSQMGPAGLSLIEMSILAPKTTPEKAKEYYERLSVEQAEGAATAVVWAIEGDVSPDELCDYLNLDQNPDVVAGLAAKEKTLTVTVAEAVRAKRADLPRADAVVFLAGGFTLEDAINLNGAEIDPAKAVLWGEVLADDTGRMYVPSIMEFARTTLDPVMLAAMPKRLSQSSTRTLTALQEELDKVSLTYDSLRAYPATFDVKAALDSLRSGVMPGDLPKTMPKSVHTLLYPYVKENAALFSRMKEYRVRKTDGLGRYTWYTSNNVSRVGARHPMAIMASLGITPEQANAYPETWTAQDIIQARLPRIKKLESAVQKATYRPRRAKEGDVDEEPIEMPATEELRSGRIITPEIAAKYRGASCEEVRVLTKGKGCTDEQYEEYRRAGLGSHGAAHAYRRKMTGAQYYELSRSYGPSLYRVDNDKVERAFRKAKNPGVVGGYVRGLRYTTKYDLSPMTTLLEEAEVPVGVWSAVCGHESTRLRGIFSGTYDYKAGRWTESSAGKVRKTLVRQATAADIIAKAGWRARDVEAYYPFHEHLDAADLADLAAANISADSFKYMISCGMKRSALLSKIRKGHLVASDFCDVRDETREYEAANAGKRRRKNVKLESTAVEELALRAAARSENIDVTQADLLRDELSCPVTTGIELAKAGVGVEQAEAWQASGVVDADEILELAQAGHDASELSSVVAGLTQRGTQVQGKAGLLLTLENRELWLSGDSGDSIDVGRIEECANAGWTGNDVFILGGYTSVDIAQHHGMTPDKARNIQAVLGDARMSRAGWEALALSDVSVSALEEVVAQLPMGSTEVGPALVRAAQLTGVDTDATAVLSQLANRAGESLIEPVDRALLEQLEQVPVGRLNEVLEIDKGVITSLDDVLALLPQDVQAQVDVFVTAGVKAPGAAVAQWAAHDKSPTWAKAFQAAAPHVPPHVWLSCDEAGVSADQAEPYWAAGAKRDGSDIETLRQAGVSPEVAARYNTMSIDELVHAQQTGLLGVRLGERHADRDELAAMLAAGIAGNTLTTTSVAGFNEISRTGVATFCQAGIALDDVVGGVARLERYQVRTDRQYQARITSFARVGLDASDAMLFADLTGPQARKLQDEGCSGAAYATYLDACVDEESPTRRRACIMRWLRNGVSPEQAASNTQDVLARAGGRAKRQAVPAT